MNYYHDYRGIEFSSPERIREAQTLLLKKHMEYLLAKSPYYRRTLKGLEAGSVDLETLTDLPFTDKTAFEKYNDELLAVPMTEVIDIVLSSGTTGKPTRIMYTENDLDRLAYNEKISFEGCGMTSDDIVLLTCTMDRCFIAGLAYFLGIKALGAAAIRNGLSSFASHMEIIERMKPTVIVGVPSFLRKLGLFMRENGLSPESTGVKKMVCIGEPIRSEDMYLLKIGEYLEDEWGVRVFSTYASSEIITTFCECTEQRGGHLHPELAIVEIIDEKGKPLPPGEAGEVVVTTLSVEGMPLLRFKTGDVSFLADDPCSCGRYSSRLGPILGRKKQMIKYRGTTVYPQAIYAVLDEFPEVNDYFITVNGDFDLSDQLSVSVSLSNGSCSTEKIMDRLQARLRVRPDVVILNNEEVRKQVLSGNSRKINRFIDRRNN